MMLGGTFELVSCNRYYLKASSWGPLICRLVSDWPKVNTPNGSACFSLGEQLRKNFGQPRVGSAPLGPKECL